MARIDVTKNTAGTFSDLTEALVVTGFNVDHYHGIDVFDAFEDGEEEEVVVHFSTKGEVTGGDNLAFALDIDSVTPQGWHRLLADEWHESWI